MNPAQVRGLAGWCAHQCLVAVAVLLGTSLLLFAVVRLAPGGSGLGLGGLPAPAPSTVTAAPSESWAAQYGQWLAGSVCGEFGTSTSLQRGRPVAESALIMTASNWNAVRFEPGDVREVELVALAGERRVYGLNNKVDAPLDQLHKRDLLPRV